MVPGVKTLIVMFNYRFTIILVLYIMQLQSWKKRLGQFVQFGSKSLPLSPNAMLIRVMLPEAAAGRPTLIDGGGEGYDKWGVRWLL